MYKFFVLDRNTWNLVIIFKLFNCQIICLKNSNNCYIIEAMLYSHEHMQMHAES